MQRPMSVDGRDAIWTDEKRGNHRTMSTKRRFHPLLSTAGFAVVLLLGVLTAGSALGSGAHSSKASVSGAVTMRSQSFTLTRPDEKRRLTVGCPGKQRPLGGGMTSSPPPSSGGEGVYPHSYERLGQQRGWHVTAVLYDPDHHSTQPRNVTLQVACGPRLGHVDPASHDQVREARPDQDGCRDLPRATAPLLRRVPAHRLHLGGWELRDRVPRDLGQVLAGRRPRLRRLRRGADRHRLLHSEQAIVDQRGLELHLARAWVRHDHDTGVPAGNAHDRRRVQRQRIDHHIPDGRNRSTRTAPGPPRATTGAPEPR